jgi:hypothetical protein
MAKEMKPHVAQAYKDATDNLIYLKREQIQVTYYTWLLLAALYILARSVDVSLKPVLLGGTFLVGAISIVILCFFQWSIHRFRRRLDHVYDVYFTPYERTRLGLNATTRRWRTVLLHSIPVSLLIATCLVASIFTFFAILALAYPSGPPPAMPRFK